MYGSVTLRSPLVLRRLAAKFCRVLVVAGVSMSRGGGGLGDGSALRLGCDDTKAFWMGVTILSGRKDVRLALKSRGCWRIALRQDEHIDLVDIAVDVNCDGSV